MTLETGTRLGRYEIRAKIGEGGMGEVYRARDSQLDRDIALKILPAEVASHRERMLSHGHAHRRYESSAAHSDSELDRDFEEMTLIGPMMEACTVILAGSSWNVVWV